MRKRSIEELATALACERPEPPVRLFGLSSAERERAEEQYRTARLQWARDCRAAAGAAASRNEGFSYPRFYSMCGLNEEERNV